MPDEKLAPLSEPRVREFVTGGRVGRLATADAAGEPHVIPLCYWFDGEHIYFAIDDKPKLTTAMKLKRMRNIAENPREFVLVIHRATKTGRRIRAHSRTRAHRRRTAGIHDRDAQSSRQVPPVPADGVDAGEKSNPVKIEPERVYAWGKRFRPTLNE